MKNCELVIVLNWLIVLLVDSAPRRIKKSTTQKFYRTGEAIALDNLIEKYEDEHYKFHKEEIENDAHLEWPAIEYKNLSDYCKEYLDHSVPAKGTSNVLGFKILRKLHYAKQNATITNEIVVVQCKILYKNHPLLFYITKAPEPTCAYALKCEGYGFCTACFIINKYCDFGGTLSINNSLKRKRKEIVGWLHRETGQPIAKDKYLLEYELEHREMLKREGEEGRSIKWPHAMEHHSLNSYCYQYLEECVPSRRRTNVSGNWKTEKLCYQKLDTNKDLYVTIVTCVPYNRTNRYYYMTRAPENNCVYALIRKHSGKIAHLAIIFKYCDFEYLSDQQIISKDYSVWEMNVIPRTEIKNETTDALETLQLFQ